MLWLQQACLSCGGGMHPCRQPHHIPVRQALTPPMSNAMHIIPGTAMHTMMPLLSGHGMPFVWAAARAFTVCEGSGGTG